MKSNKERMSSIMKKVDDYKIYIRKRNAILTSAFCCLFLAVGLGVIDFNNTKFEDDLPRFQSEDELLAMLRENTGNVDDFRFGSTNGTVIFDLAMPESAQSSLKADSVTNNKVMEKEESSFSETNTQVQGVDEADIVKTNGDYIYYLSNGKLRVFDTKTEDTKLVKEINFDSTNYTRPFELYINDEYIIVIASSRIDKDEPEVNRKYYWGDESAVKAIIYDINTYEVKREIEIDGDYVSSRKVDNNFYIVTNKYINTYGDINAEDIMPLYKDTASEVQDYCKIPVTDIRYFPDFDNKDCSYMIISSFNLDNIDNEVNIYTCLGAGNEIYSSRGNLYVTKSVYEKDNYTTAIHKFEIKNGKVKYSSTGNVPGTLLNQFSMDEYNGYFRITTTKGNTWDNTSENNLYVLDESLNIVGTLEGLAKGEKIYSTRFMGEKCYVVTYKTVDPLFVIDLAEPTNPNVLGELKIPGYSSYLHPLGENYLIGFGEDSVEKSFLNWRGETEVTAYATGLKMAIFDVSDYNNPKELHSIKMGARGSSSQLLYNHKSLLFDEEKGIIAFPANLTKDAGSYDNGVPRYGETFFNGALIYDISVEDGIKLRGQIEHQIEGKKYKDSIERIIYIGDNLYTLSPSMIKVSDLETIEEKDRLTIENKEENVVYQYMID